MSSSANKRHSILPPVSQSGPKAPVRFSSSLTIAESALLTGSHLITLRTESLVHPRAKIESKLGPVDIGKRCIVHERTHVGAAPSLENTPLNSPVASSPTAADNEPRGEAAAAGTGVTVGDYSLIQSGAVIEAGGTVLKEGVLVGTGSRIGSGAVIGEWCTISALSVIPPNAKIDDYTVVFSRGLQRRDKREVRDIRKKQQLRQLEVQRKLIPSNPAKFAPS